MQSSEGIPVMRAKAGTTPRAIEPGERPAQSLIFPLSSTGRRARAGSGATLARRAPVRIRNQLILARNTAGMRVVMATVIALLILNFVDEHFNNARFTQAATVMLSQIVQSFG
jgi:hypothetical protein